MIPLVPRHYIYRCLACGTEEHIPQSAIVNTFQKHKSCGTTHVTPVKRLPAWPVWVAVLLTVIAFAGWWVW